MIKMIVNLAEESQSLNLNQLEHSILRNFGGFDPDQFNPLDIFKSFCPSASALPHNRFGIPPVSPEELIKASLSAGQYTSFNG